MVKVYSQMINHCQNDKVYLRNRVMEVCSLQVHLLAFNCINKYHIICKYSFFIFYF